MDGDVGDDLTVVEDLSAVAELGEVVGAAAQV
jgi:hypothetical protein